MKDQITNRKWQIKTCAFLILSIILCDTAIAYANEFIDITVIADAPWRINSGDWIPINLMIKEAKGEKAYSLEAIYIYDNNNQQKSINIYNENGGQIGNTLGGELPKRIDQHLWNKVIHVNKNDLVKTLYEGKFIYNISVLLSGHYEFCNDICPRAFNIRQSFTIIDMGYSLPKLSNIWFCGDSHYHTVDRKSVV